MGALIKKTEARSGRHIFEASGPSLPFPNCQSGGGIARHCALLPPQSSKLAGMSLYVQVFGCRDDAARHALGWPAAEKRQGTKSRKVCTGGTAGAVGSSPRVLAC
jgi:hypothetical protein